MSTCPVSLRTLGTTGVTAPAGRAHSGSDRRRGAVAPTPSRWHVSVVAILVVAVLLVATMALGRSDGGSLTAVGPVPPGQARSSGPVAPVAQRSYVVGPGDTLWSIARGLQPQGDLRPLVDRLAAGRHGGPLRVGERVALAP